MATDYIPGQPIKLIEGLTYHRIDCSEHTVAGPCKEHPELVYTIQGDWYEKDTGRYVRLNPLTDKYEPWPMPPKRDLVALVE
jgi:hypothetical protein